MPLEAVLLLIFGLFGAGINFYAGLFVPLTVRVLRPILQDVRAHAAP